MSNKVHFKVVGNLQVTIAHGEVSCQVNSLQSNRNQAIKIHMQDGGFYVKIISDLNWNKTGNDLVLVSTD